LSWQKSPERKVALKEQKLRRNKKKPQEPLVSSPEKRGKMSHSDADRSRKITL